jgi:hypothetical protein
VNQRVAVFLADLTVLVAVSGINCHLVLPTNLETSVAPTFGGWGAWGGTGPLARPTSEAGGRPAKLETKLAAAPSPRISP